MTCRKLETRDEDFLWSYEYLWGVEDCWRTNITDFPTNLVRILQYAQAACTHSALLEWLDNDFTVLAYNRPVCRLVPFDMLPLPSISDDSCADLYAYPNYIKQAFVALFGDDIGKSNARLILAWWRMHPELDLQAWLTSPITQVAYPFE